MIYEINTSALDEFKNKGGGGGLNKEEYTTLLRENYNHVSKIISQVEELKEIDGYYIFGIRYIAKIPPKTNRHIFNLNWIPKDLSDIRQKTVRTYYEDGKPNTEIYYEISDLEYEEFLKKIKDLLNLNPIGNTSVKGDLLKKVINSDDFFSISTSNKISTTKIVEILYIEKYINKLIKEGILSIGVNYFPEQNFALLSPIEYDGLISIAPWIVLGTKSDFRVSAGLVGFENFDTELNINNPNKITIGVIDSGLNLPDEYDPFINKIDARENKNFSDTKHGSSVSSIIIASDELNPGQRDNLGNFNVRHFEILEPLNPGEEAVLSFIYLIKKLPIILEENKDIRVWNLSFGGLKSPYSLTVSELGAFLDEMSYKFNVLFVIASGNERQEASVPIESLNTPADSLNAISVGSVVVDKGNIKFAEYSSIGQILHFEKPEVSHFGGPNNSDSSAFIVQKANSKGVSSGTSFSTPRISRMAAWMIHKENMTTQEAKAKIIALATREKPKNKSSSFGYIKGYDEQKVELKMTTKISGKNPLYLPINLPKGTKTVTITSAHHVKPNRVFGEEYSVHNLEIKLHWYCTGHSNPEHYNLTKSVKEEKTNDKKYQKEVLLRFEAGKYFNSKKKLYLNEKIEIAKKELESKCPGENYELALRIKKLDLFETQIEQTVEASFYVNIEGDFDTQEFENINKTIIEVEVETEI